MIQKTIKTREFPGTTSPAESERERKNREKVRRFAAEGIVLLKNEGPVLPLKKGSKVALFGVGAAKTVKGGTGSGDVNERESVSIYQGMKNAGFEIANEEMVKGYARLYDEKRIEWRNSIIAKAQADGGGIERFFDAYSHMPFRFPAGGPVEKTEADTALFVVSRIAGENADRRVEKGDYRLSAEEAAMLADTCRYYEKVVVVVNSGGPVDLSFLDEHPNIYGLIFMSQAGMEGGSALADLLSGKTGFSGKLTDTWAFRYEDYPNAATFSHNNGNVKTEKYSEGIYVGYRYFDTFSVPARFGFGFGLSYTAFRTEMKGISLCGNAAGEPQIRADVEVRNTGDTFSGREVVQLYVSCPDGKLEKEYRRLAAFGKTKPLRPGESQRLSLRFPLYQLASYDESEPGWVLEPGFYGVWIGNSLNGARLASKLHLGARSVMVKTQHICPLKEELGELTQDTAARKARYAAWSGQSVPTTLELDTAGIAPKTPDYAEPAWSVGKEAGELADTLPEERLIKLATGDPCKGQGSNVGSAGVSVPGSAGETDPCAEDRNLPTVVLADGPAGLRLNPYYDVVDGEIVPMPFEASIEQKLFFMGAEEKTKGTRYYQYCTAIPVGTLLAQTWDTELLAEVGALVGGEMREFGVTLWLAPGMNIHRNPLCGRNFEYYSEDPLVAGVMAAAITSGVQSEPGCGTTIKHFACNNQEENRMGSNSVLSERALREIYLKGFEIAVTSSQPMSIMTSYNLINGVHSANNFDLCTKAARCEWGFRGAIMTDWMTTEHGPDCTAAGCMRAGNDLVMPGNLTDRANLKAELEAGTLTLHELKSCVARLIGVILQSNRYEGARSYTEQSGGCEPYITCK